MYSATVIADSVTEFGVRALTMELRYPYSIHQDMLTYRSIGKSDDREFDRWLEFSRSSASNRALTMEKIIEAIIDDPVIPKFRKQSIGMTPGDFLSDREQLQVQNKWLNTRDFVISQMKDIKKTYGVHKSQVNRALAPWQWITTIFTANEQHWQHFFDERAHPSADPLLQPVAYLAKDAYLVSNPDYLRYGEWHLPFVTEKPTTVGDEQTITWIDLAKISAAKCARTSYVNQWKDVSMRDDMKLFNDLVVREASNTEPVHAAPTEHQLKASTPKTHSGNVYGFEQFRKMLGL